MRENIHLLPGTTAKSLFDSRARNALDLFKKFGDVKHSGEKGMLREIVVRQLLSAVLPHTFGIGSGVIIDAWDRQGRQADIIIFDKRLLPPLFMEDGRGIFPIDSVLRVLEVKSRLDADDLPAIVDAASLIDGQTDRSLRITVGRDIGTVNYPLIGCFAFDTSLNFEKAVEQLREARVNVGCIVSQGRWCSETTHPNTDELTNIRNFISTFLHSIEADAETRSMFTLGHWLYTD